MARTIGKKYRKQVEELVKKAESFDIHYCGDVAEFVISEMPSEAFDTWEGAYNEIERLVHDIIMDFNS